MDVTVGATTWYAQWKMDGSSSVDPALLYGPMLAIQLTDNFGLTSVFLTGKLEDDSGPVYHRYDSDTTLNYRLNSYFKIFAGFKYMGYRMEFDNEYTNYDLSVDGIGPAAGISVVLPLGANFFVLANGSAMYLWNKFSETGQSDSTDKAYGANATASLAYYIAPASVTLSLGGRYQYLKYTGSSDSKHDIYGVTAAATYTFNL